MDGLMKCHRELRHVMEMIREAAVRREERERVRHERFNVFTTLLKANDEERLHTRYLHCLLDPAGLHDCGPMFLELFWETLRETPGVDGDGKAAAFEVPGSAKDWSVRKEVHCPGFGRIDLLLEGPGGAIAIENKIHAAEGEAQLNRYSEYLGKPSRETGQLLYLTLDGSAGASAGGNPYIRISYAEHILAWLEKCLRASYEAAPVNEVLRQYRQVVRQLTGKTMEQKSMKPVIKYIRENPNLILYRAEFNAAIDEAVATIWNDLAHEIEKGLGDAFKVQRSTRDAKDGLGTKGDLGGIVIKPPQEGWPADVPFEIWAERDEHSFGIGPVPKADWNGSAEEATKLYAAVFEELHGKGLYHRKITPTERFPAGWHNLLETTEPWKVAQLGPNDTERMCGEIRDYVKNLKEAFVAARAACADTRASGIQEE